MSIPVFVRRCTMSSAGSSCVAATFAHQCPSSVSRRWSGVAHKEQFAYLSVDHLHVELLRHGRRSMRDHAALASILDELITRHDRNKRGVLRDATFHAHATGLYSRCTELFLTAARQDVGLVVLSEAVVESADAQNSSSLLVSVTAAVAGRLVDVPHDAVSEIAVYRAFWIAARRFVDAERNLHRLRRAAARDEERAQPENEPQRLFPRHEISKPQQQQPSSQPQLFTEETDADLNEATGKTLEYLHLAQHVFFILAAINGKLVTTAVASDPSHFNFHTLWEKTKQFVRYYDLIDRGEAAFYRFCYTQQFFRLRFSVATINSCIRSCHKAKHVAWMREYYGEYEAHVMAQRSAAETSAGDAATSPRHGGGGSSRSGELQELVVHTYLQGLVSCGAFAEVARVGSSLLLAVDNYTPSHSVAAVIARASGETRNLPLAIACASVIFAGANAASSPPSSADPSQSSTSVHDVPTGFEVFTSLMALAKTQAPQFLALLERLQDSAHLAPSQEEIFCLRLYYVRRSPHVREHIDALLAPLEAKPLASLSLFTSRNMTLVLLCMLSCDHPRFYDVLRDYYERSAERRLLWLTLFCLWAEPKRFALSTDQRKWALSELKHQHEMIVAASTSTPNAKTNSVWHSVVNHADVMRFKDVASLRGAVAAFLADCCRDHMLISSMDAFCTSSLVWPVEETALRVIHRAKLAVHSTDGTAGFSSDVTDQRKSPPWLPLCVHPDSSDFRTNDGRADSEAVQQNVASLILRELSVLQHATDVIFV